MKFNSLKPKHWCYLAAFTLQAIIGLALRAAKSSMGKRREGLILLYGHKLNGNLLAIYRQVTENRPDLDCILLSMDADYCRELKQQGIRCQWSGAPRSAHLLATASVLISDHGLHALQPFLLAYQRLGLKFVDVWHGIPFKGFDAGDFRVQHKYDEVWVASGSQKVLWTQRFDFPENIVKATGYARTDQLVNSRNSRAQALDQLGLTTQEGRTTILFAPTWAQDQKGRSIYPFNHDAETFLDALSAFCVRHDAVVLMRNHINSAQAPLPCRANIIPVPSSTFTDSELILSASDMLICDWSSIAFDFLLTDRPTIFLDVPPPFRKGFSLGPEFRFGAVCKTLPDLLLTLETCISNPAAYWQAYLDSHRKTKKIIYEGFADGLSSARCMQRLLTLI